MTTINIAESLVATVDVLRSCFLFCRSPVRLSVQRLAILTEGLRAFPHSLQKNPGEYLKLGRNRSFPQSLKFIIC
jgi:hypothetical protein